MSEHVHSLLGPYAVGALEPDERAHVERHVTSCADCRDELSSYLEATAALADAEATAPPASLRDRVMAEVAMTSQLPPRSADAPVTDPIRVAEDYGRGPAADDAPATTAADAAAASAAGTSDDLADPRERRAQRRGVRRWLPALAGAAATVAVLAVGVFGFGLGRPSDDAAELALAKDVMMVEAASDATKMDMDLGNGQVVMSSRMDAVALMGRSAPMPDHGTEYQVWLILEDGSKVAGPTFMPDADGEYMAYVPSDLDGVVAIAITCEPPGGSAEPTTDVVSVVEL